VHQPNTVKLVCAVHRRMPADGFDAGDCKEPSVGVMVEDLVPLL